MMATDQAGPLKELTHLFCFFCKERLMPEGPVVVAMDSLSLWMAFNSWIVDAVKAFAICLSGLQLIGVDQHNAKRDNAISCAQARRFDVEERNRLRESFRRRQLGNGSGFPRRFEETRLIASVWR